MVNVPLAQFPPGQAPALTAALVALLCTVLGAAQVVDGAITAVVDEGTAVAAVEAATAVLQVGAATGLERARWRAASREATSA